MPARKNRGATKGSMPQQWKDKIRAGMIADRLYKCFNGDLELSTAQLKAGEILFKRMEPELQRSEVNMQAKIDYTQLPDLPKDQVHAIEGDVDGRYGALPPQLH